jgi:hypothetical protein
MKKKYQITKAQRDALVTAGVRIEDHSAKYIKAKAEELLPTLGAVKPQSKREANRLIRKAKGQKSILDHAVEIKDDIKARMKDIEGELQIVESF